MKRHWKRIGSALAMAITLACCLGCVAPRRGISKSSAHTPDSQFAAAAIEQPTSGSVTLVSHQQRDETPEQLPALQPADSIETTQNSLAELEGIALTNNPTLRRMRLEAAAEFAKVGYVGKLPDPSIGAMAYAPPMNYEPDRLLAEFQVMQMIPWLGRLKAESRRAYLEALAAANDYQAERLRLLGDLRVAWYELYVLQKQIEITHADRSQLESLLNTANARVRTGDAQPGDVLMATLELSNLQEQLLKYRQQIASTTAELNRIVGRDSQTSVPPPEKIHVEMPSWNYELLRDTALGRQPELNATRLRTSAARWGIEVARLQRRPDLTFGANWMVMDAPGAAAPEAGRDSVALGVTATIPIWHGKYDAMRSEAVREHTAASVSEEEVALRLDAKVRDLWEQARANHETVQLYENTILPQARQTFEANQASLVNNAVTFDRVIRDFRTLLGLELSYHRALSQLATSLARIREVIGEDLAACPEP
jgi:outer membrane protein TolC